MNLFKLLKLWRRKTIPPVGKENMKRTDRLGMRVKPSDKKRWKEQAALEGLSLSSWIEQCLNKASSPRGMNGLPSTRTMSYPPYVDIAP